MNSERKQVRRQRKTENNMKKGKRNINLKNKDSGKKLKSQRSIFKHV